MRIAVAQLSLVDGDYTSNFAKITATVERYGPDHDLIVLPETATSGFASRNDVERLAETLDGATITRLKQLTQEYSVAIVCGLAERDGAECYNTAVFVADGEVLLTYRKTHLWVDEVDKFSSGQEYCIAPWRNWNLGALICFDIEFPETARVVAALGARVIVVCDGNMMPYGRSQKMLACARALENQVFVAIANRVGAGRNDTFAGGSMIIDPAGTVLVEANEEAEAVLSAEIDLSQVEHARRGFEYLKLRRLRMPCEADDAADGRLKILRERHE